MNQMNYKQLTQIIASLVTTDKTMSGDFEALRSSTTKLLDKIARLVNLEQTHEDKLSDFDADKIDFGTVIEEFYEELAQVQEGELGALTPEDPNYRKPFYSYPLGKKKFKMTIYNYDLEKASRNPQDFAKLMASKTKVFADSETEFKYALKRGLLANLIELCEKAMSSENETFDTSASYRADTYVKDDDSPTKFGIIVKEYTGGEALGWDNAVALGYIVELDLIKEIAKPTDTESGEAFIKQVKADIEVAQDSNDGHSIGGNCLGAQKYLKLFFTQGVKPSIAVDVKSGTFNLSQITFDCPDTVVKDFGNADASYYCILMDTRIIRLFPLYEAVRSNTNGDLDLTNYFKHMDFNAKISPYGYVKLYKVVSNSNKEVKTSKKVK